MVQIHNGILLNHKKDQNNAICSKMDDLEIIIQSEVREITIYDTICGI